MVHVCGLTCLSRSTPWGSPGIAMTSVSFAAAEETDPNVAVAAITATATAVAPPYLDNSRKLFIAVLPCRRFPSERAPLSDQRPYRSAENAFIAHRSRRRPRRLPPFFLVFVLDRRTPKMNHDSLFVSSDNPVGIGLVCGPV